MTWFRRSRLLLATLSLLGLGLFGLGVTAGFWLADRYATPTVPALRLSDADASAGDGQGRRTVVVPDVAELPLSDAEDALADAGVDLAIVTSTRTPWAGAPGRVVAQDPRRGTPDPDRVRLMVAVPARVPPVTGLARVRAEEKLTALGAVVVVVPTYDPKARLGTVLAVEPKAGAILPGSVRLRVAGEPAAVYLDALSTTEGGCSTGRVTIGSTDYAHTLSCRAYSNPATTAYALNGAIDRFETSVTVESGDPPMRLRVLLDGRALLTTTVRAGPLRAVSLAVRGGRSLQLEVTSLDSSRSSTLQLADARLLGADAAIDRQAQGG